MTTPTYDPSGYSVDEVNAYLADNPDQRETVLAAERDGKARKGILGDGSAEQGTADGVTVDPTPSDANGAVKGYLGHDAADLAEADAARAAGLAPTREVTPTVIENGPTPPAGHVADPTSQGHVGSAG